MTTSAVTPTARIERLANANRIRLERAALKRTVHELGYVAGALRMAAVIEHLPEWLESMPMGELLQIIPRWGVDRTDEFLNRNLIGWMKPAGALTERQRDNTAAALRRRAGDYGGGIPAAELGGLGWRELEVWS